MKDFIKYKSLNIALFLIILFLIGGCKKESDSTSLIAQSKTQEDTAPAQENTNAIQKYDDEEDFIVTVLDGEWPNTAPCAVSIVGYKGNKKEVRIPPEIQNLPIYYIKDKAFQGKQLTMVSIPDSVMGIENEAFSENNLTDITIPKNVREIGERAFYGNKLINITMYYGLKKIGREAFAKNQLTNIKIPDSVEKIYPGAFANNRLTSITTPEELYEIGNDVFKDNPVTTVIVSSIFHTLFAYEQPFPYSFYDFYEKETTGHGIYTWNGSSWSVKHYDYTDPKRFDIKINDDDQSVTIKRYTGFNPVVNIPPKLRGLPVTVVRGFSGRELTSVIIPEGVTHVGGFSANKLTSIIIPESVTHIEDEAFQLNYLTSVIIPDSVIYIGKNAFWRNRLTGVTFGKNVTTIESFAFAENELTDLTLGNNVTTIGTCAFAENKLTSVKLSNSLKVIYEDAFIFYNHIIKITIPENVSILDRWGEKEAEAFYDKFEEFYDKNRKKGGTYIYNKDKKTWSFNK
jgi:hypothetical protein